MQFSAAMQLVEGGKRLRRKAWQHDYVVWLDPYAPKVLKAEAAIRNYVPSQDDMLADDWQEAVTPNTDQRVFPI